MSTAFDLILRRVPDADALLDDPRAATALISPLAAISAAGLLAWALAQTALVAGLATAEAAPLLVESSPLQVTLALFAAGAAGLFGAQLAGLPTFYFYALLAGIPTHGWRVAVESLRAQATAGLVLLSVVPVHLALGFGLRLVEPGGESAVGFALLGLGLPFVTGIFAPITLIRSMRRLAAAAEGSGRKPLPTLLALGWSAVFSAMAPMGFARILDLLLDIG